MACSHIRGWIIMGPEDSVIITLQTKYNLDRKLSDIDVGALVTWTGHRISSDGDSETWVINTIRAVESD